MASQITLVTAISDCQTTLTQFAETSLRNTPAEVLKIVIDNSPFPAPHIPEILAYWTRAYSNVVLLRKRNDLSPFPSHGDALDLALDFVQTPFLVTFDFDFMLHDPGFWEVLQETQQRTQATIMGTSICATADYIHPFCALYETENARRHRFYKRPRTVEGQKYIRSSETDEWREERERTCDVGEALYIQTAEAGLPTFSEFEAGLYGEHLAARAPYGHVDFDQHHFYATRKSGKYLLL